MITKAEYELAKKNGKLEKLRSDEISRRISAKYSFSNQIAILMDKDTKPDEWDAYQEFRATVKAEVDKEFAEIEEEQTNAIHTTQ